MSIITLSNIEKQFSGVKLFSEFHLEVEQGEYVIITGKSGAGKTTLLNMIGLLEVPDKGELTICNVKNPNINKKSGRLLVRDHIGYLFQNFALVEKLTAKQNIELVCRLKKLPFTDKKVTMLLETLGIGDLVHKKIYQLSGGEQQRVALARLFIKEPDILLADEPTASLDPQNTQIVLDAIARLHAKGATVILVTHNPELIPLADRCVHIS